MRDDRGLGVEPSSTLPGRCRRARTTSVRILSTPVSTFVHPPFPLPHNRNRGWPVVYDYPPSRTNVSGREGGGKRHGLDRQGSVSGRGGGVSVAAGIEGEEVP